MVHSLLQAHLLLAVYLITRLNMLSKIINDKKAQVSIEYLIMVVFGTMLVIITGIIIVNLSSLITLAKTKILNYRDSILATL